MMNINKYWLFATVASCVGSSAFCSQEQVEKETAEVGSPSQSMTNCKEEDGSESKNSIVLKDTGRHLMMLFANSRDVQPEDPLEYYKAGIEKNWTTFPKGSSFDKQRKRSTVEDLSRMIEEFPAKMQSSFDRLLNSGRYPDEVVQAARAQQAGCDNFIKAIQQLAPIYSEELAKLEEVWKPLDEFYKARQSAIESYHSDRPLAKTLCEFVQKQQVTLPVRSGESKYHVDGLCFTLDVPCLENQINTIIHHFEKLGYGDESISLALEEVIDLLQDTRVEPWRNFSNRMGELKNFLSSNEDGFGFFHLSHDEKLDFVADVLVDKYHEIKDKIRQEKRRRESRLPFGIQPITGNHEVDLALIASMLQGGF